MTNHTVTAAGVGGDVFGGGAAAGGGPRPFVVSDARYVHAQNARSTETALTYVAVILACYLVGMLVLLLHHVR